MVGDMVMNKNCFGQFAGGGFMRVSWLEIEIPGWEILVARTRALQLISLKPQSNSRVEHIMSEKGLPVRE